MITLILLTALPAVAGIALLVAGSRASRRAPAVSLTVASVTAIAAVVSAVTRPELDLPFITANGGRLAVDGLTAVLLPTVVLVALLVLVFATAERTGPAARFHGLMLVFVAAVMVTLAATELPALLAAWEVMGATSYALIGFSWQESKRVSAGFVAFAVTRSADLGLYLAAGVAIAAGVGFGLADLSEASAPLVHVIAAGMLVAGLGKAAQLPFSFWLSRAMEGPSPVSALLHSAAMVAMGGYLLLRMEELLDVAGWAASVTAWVGALTAIALGIVAVAQSDLKQVLAASTSAQLGFVVLAAGVGATAGGAAQLIAHAATKALLFMVAGAWLTALGSKRLEALQGVGWRWRLVGAVFAVGALALAGIPPLSLWATKDAVLAAALAETPLLYASGLVGAALSAAYAANLIAVVFAKPEQGERQKIERSWDTEEKGTRRITGAAIAPMVVLAVSAAGLGVLALPGLVTPFRSLIGGATEPRSTVVELVASGAIAVVLVALVLRRRVPRLKWALDWFGLERVAVASVWRPMLVLADGLARFDLRLAAAVDGTARSAMTIAGVGSDLDTRIDGVVDGSVVVLDRSGDDSSRLDRAVDRVVGAVSAGAAGLGRVARRTQTGSIADYYAGAAVITVAGILLLIVVR